MREFTVRFDSKNPRPKLAVSAQSCLAPEPYRSLSKTWNEPSVGPERSDRSRHPACQDLVDRGRFSSRQDARSTMDAKANTHVCPSPFAQTGPDGEPTAAASAYMIVVNGSIPGTMLRSDRSRHHPRPLGRVRLSDRRQHRLATARPGCGWSRRDRPDHRSGQLERHVREQRVDPRPSAHHARRRRPRSIGRESGAQAGAPRSARRAISA